MKRPVVLLGALATLAATPALGQHPWYTCGMTDRLTQHRIAESYAPALKFWEEELDFPSFPFADAFDGLPQGANPALDFDDPDEVVPFVNADGDRANWNALNERPRTDEPGRRYVFYRIRCTSEHETRLMERFLRKDAQAWSRTNMEASWRQMKDRSLVVVEYYFYYLNDHGLGGHAQDIEFLYVFVPNDARLREDLRIIVGAGHSSRTPNGVLVIQNDSLKQTNAAVEYGGHATVPLRDGDSEAFRYAYDVNWHVPDTWGPRDVMAVSGQGFVGAYSNQLSFQRRARLNYSPDDSATSYRLAPADLFSRLYRAIEDNSPDRILAVLDTISLVWDRRFFAVPASLSGRVMQRLALWPRGFEVNGQAVPESRHQPWLHKHYLLEPSVILKDHLYRPATWSVWDNVSWGTTTVARESTGAYLGYIIPAAYFPFYVPGIVEVAGGVAAQAPGRTGSFFTDNTPAPFVTITYDNSYRDYITYFFKATWTYQASERLDIDASALSISLGPSLLLWSSDRRNTYFPAKVANAVRLRAGPRFYANDWNDLVRRTAFEFSLSFRQ
jgi:hypothetical protein